MSIDVVLPAGGRISGEFAEEAGVEVKALIDIGGRTVLERTLEVLRASQRVHRAIVVGAREIVEHNCARLADAVLSEGISSGPANILRGIEWLREADGSVADRILVLTTDLPFLTPEVVSAFLDLCPPDADICVPLVREETFLERFPGSQNFYVKLADGRWTMGCGFLVNPAAIETNREHIERVFAARKSQLGMARLLGIGFTLRFLVGRLTVAQIERRCVEMLGCSGKSIPDSPPELAFDLDRVEDYRYALRTCRHEGASHEKDG